MKKIAIVGAGLTGLIAAKFAENRGADVTVFDPSPGGRARSPQLGGSPMNLGPHAMYVRGELARTLTELEIAAHGDSPVSAHEWVNGSLHPMFTGPLDILAGGDFALTRVERLTFARAYARILIGVRDPVTFRAWAAKWPAAIHLRLLALVRLATYSEGAADLPARIVAKQLALASSGVRYLDQGWQSIVDELIAKLRRPIVTQKVRSVHASGSGVKLRTETAHRFDHVVVAVPPDKAAKLLVDTSPSHTLTTQVISSLDIATSAPTQGPAFVLGIDQPFYFSDHGRVANFGNRNGALHVASYTGATREELEELADRFATGWRRVTIGTRYLPRITVSYGMPGHRAPAACHERVTFAGDWVETAGDYFLADAVAASARAAADLATTGVSRVAAA
jgi:glycine/D-amino acid oxidase-like deaminating enzyme